MTMIIKIIKITIAIIIIITIVVNTIIIMGNLNERGYSKINMRGG